MSVCNEFDELRGTIQGNFGEQKAIKEGELILLVTPQVTRKSNANLGTVVGVLIYSY